MQRLGRVQCSGCPIRNSELKKAETHPAFSPGPCGRGKSAASWAFTESLGGEEEGKPGAAAKEAGSQKPQPALRKTLEQSVQAPTPLDVCSLCVYQDSSALAPLCSGFCWGSAPAGGCTLTPDEVCRAPAVLQDRPCTVVCSPSAWPGWIQRETQSLAYRRCRRDPPWDTIEPITTVGCLLSGSPSTQPGWRKAGRLSEWMEAGPWLSL